jgi:anthranilate synthase component 1
MSARRGKPRALVRPLDVPPEVLRHLAATQPKRYPALFDSAAEGPLGRMSILAALPRASLWLDRAGLLHAEGVAANGGGFLNALDQWWLAERAPVSAPDMPFVGGWVVFLAYEIAKEVEPRLALPVTPLPWNAFALRTPCALVHEKASNQVFAVAEPEAVDALDMLEADARAAAVSAASSPPAVRAQSIREEAPDRYLARVERAKQYIRDGDIYQANLSRPWRIELSGEPDIAGLYARLCATNPAPFAALVQWQGLTLLSSSPERLVRIGGGHIETRPIAGTRPRSHSPGKDSVELAELTAHPKERAEHIMLIDLERNDLGRVCEAGSVRVDELMVTETYAHVHHIVSNVRGHLRSDVTPIQALRAVFPGGTITGVPKVRCMQIIAELEGEGRGAYTGSLGFLSRDGTMDLNILIRTMTLRGREIELRAGAGIVADSDPTRELEETRAKARGLLAVFEI